MLRLGWTSCPFCSREDIYVSHPKTVLEEVVVLVLLQPVRCHDCMRRFLRPLFASPPAQVPVRKVTLKQSPAKSAGTKDTKRAA